MDSEFNEMLAALAWSGWGALGAGTWGSDHRSWSVDPEALLLLTGSLQGLDPRVRDESTRWVGEHQHLLSRTRLRRLLTTWPETDSWGGYAARLGAATGQLWPGRAESVVPAVSIGKGAASMGDQLVLRLRAGIGVGVRSELLRVMLAGTVTMPATAAQLAGESGYGKRGVAAAAEQMAAAGVLGAIPRGNAIAYRLANSAAWGQLFGPLPTVSLSFLSAARAAATLVLGLRTGPRGEDLAGAPVIVRTVAARALLRQAADDLSRLGADIPMPIADDAYPEIEQFTRRLLSAISTGAAP